ncbi:PREDICTED: putative pentatricopeptide repeat-containing protein At5g06400, mitochondrial [Fragaria vesca subsp. vesca]|uniref:putative pentatricopeptide repeat-containing protein At5g06400, mitochondrial n=1 Tax=Fragaria vesca subsp. vesca TaxID=101020 RepID=UPI0002C3363E|nr:PREDICTED: putative pentatricopeptide repeat-containing protein At5g06400, mitochondrial [Fragaria vesca subsp. vesca]
MRGLATKLQSLCLSSTSKIFRFRLSRVHRIDNFATLTKLSKPKKAQLKQVEEASSFGLLFSEITQILGAENVTADKTPSGFFISKDTYVGVGEVLKERAPCLPSVKTAEDDALRVKEDVAVVEETSVAEADVSPVVHEVTRIVRAESGLVSMEERLDELRFELDSEIVDNVLKRCFKVPHLALRFFDWVKMREGFCHTTKIYNTVLCIAGDVKEFGMVEKLVEEMERNSCKKDVKTWTILIQMYGKAKLVGRALLVYEKMKKFGFEPDAVVFRIMITALCAAGKADVAMEFYKEMVQKDIGLDIKMYKLLLNSIARYEDTAAAVGLVSDNMIRVSQIPEHVVYGCVLKSFCISGRIREALGYIRELKNKEFMLLPEYFETLVKGLCRADRIADALEILDIMKKRDFVDGNVYGIIINGYLRKNDVSRALDLFHGMKESGYLPTTSTYTELMQHLFNMNEHQKGCELYDEMLERGVEPDSVAVTAIVAGHVRQNHISEAWKVFIHMKDKGIKPTSKSYMVFIKELCKISRTDEILKVLVHMQASDMRIQDEIFNWVILHMKKKGEMDSLEKVKQMRSVNKFQPHDVGVSSNDASTGERIKTVLDSVPKKLDPLSNFNAYDDKDLQEICKILSSSTDWYLVQEALEKSAVVFTPGLVLSILKSHSAHGLVALQFFSWIGKQSGYRHTTDTYNMAIKIAGRGKDFKHMRNLLYEMRRNRFPITQDTWTIMIMQYGRTGLTEIALQLFREMKSNCNPTGSTYKYLIISLCGRKGRKVDEAIKTFQEMIRAAHIPDKELVETYIGCLCEVDKLSDARRCIDSLSKVGFTTSLSYSLYIRALCRAGRLQEASEMMDDIGEERSTLDRYTYGSFVHGLLRSGQVEEALAKMESMKQAGMKPTVHVYTSLIVHFLKEKQIKRALEIFNEMQQEGCEPTVVTYSTLIRGYMNMEMTAEAWSVFHNMKLKGPSPDFKTYSMFLHCLCKAGKSEEAMQLITEMLNSGIIPSVVNFRTVFYGLNREGKHDLARTVMEQKSSSIRKRKFLI